MKLYDLLKARREKRATQSKKDAEDREHLEADLGRRIEATNTRERQLWESKYREFDQSHTSAAASVA